jgi:hypothetical protein
MTFLHKLGEGLQVVIPLDGISDITAAGVDRVTALATHLVGVKGGLRLPLHKVVAEVRIVHRGSAKSVDTDDDYIRFDPFPLPSAVSEGIGLAAAFPMVDEDSIWCAARGKRY